MKKYIVISNDIRNKIVTGEYKANEKIPFEKELCINYESSKMTIKKALDILVTEGLIIKRRGSGTFVKDISPREMERLSLANQFRGTTALNPNKTVLSKILNFSIIPCPEEVQSKLNLTEESFVYDIYRVRHIDGRPTVMEKMYMPIDLIPRLKEKTIKYSIYEYIEEELNLVIQSGHRNISARKATDFEAENLQLEKGDPVVVAQQIGYLDTGAAFEYSISVHRYEDFSIDIILTRD